MYKLNLRAYTNQIHKFYNSGKAAFLLNTAIILWHGLYNYFQGKKTAVLISQLLLISPDRESRKQLEIFSLQLLHRPLEFSACGLFTLDRTLVTSVGN